jgi:hypothetical protein
MRWFGPAAVALLLTCGTAAAATPAGQSSSASKNLLLNPGFEKGLSDHLWMPAAWDTFQSGLNTVFFGRDTLLRHSGRYSVSIANLSSYVPMFHNWSQSLVVGRELWGKDVVFTVWTHSDGLQGRAYVLLQAYRDTITKMSKIWKIDRESARERLRILKSDDPLVTLGWSRDYFSAPETDWVKREVRIFVPPSANVVVVRCGIFGVGQVTFDDASLVAQAARTPEAMPLQTNLFKDPGFEGSGDDWEYSMPPYEGLEIARDSTVAHSGRASIRMDGGVDGPVQVRTGVCQSVANRGLVGKRLRLSGWVKTDSLQGNAYIMAYCSTANGDVYDVTPAQFGMNTDWTKTQTEFDVPPGTLMVWGWFLFNCPARGRVYYDDVSLEILGPANYVQNGTPPPKPRMPGR